MLFSPLMFFGGIGAFIIAILFYLLLDTKAELKNEREISTARAIAIENYEASIKSANEELKNQPRL